MINLRKFGYALLLFFLAPFAAAQFTTVSGTVTDPNGLAYANGTITATLVSSGSPKFTATNQPYTPPTQPVGLNSAGSFVMQLADNTQLTPGGSTWSFTVSCAAGCVPAAGGKGPVSFTVTGVTISGSSQSITSTLTAAALPLSNISGGGSGTVSPGTAGQVGIYAASGTTISGDAGLTHSGGILTFADNTSAAGYFSIQSTQRPAFLAGSGSPASNPFAQECFATAVSNCAAGANVGDASFNFNLNNTSGGNVFYGFTNTTGTSGDIIWQNTVGGALQMPWRIKSDGSLLAGFNNQLKGDSSAGIDLRRPPYNASCAFTGGGATTTTNGTVTAGTSVLLTSASGFAAGQGVFIAGAGAAGGVYNGVITAVGGSTLTVAPATSTSVTNATVVSFGWPIQTTTNGTVGSASTTIPVVSANTFAAGQGIYIAGAGAASANYTGVIQSVSSNNIVVSPATSTSVTNALVQHDETNALNSAITDLSNYVTSGTLRFPAGICLLNGPLLRTGDANAVIPLPSVPYNPGGSFNSGQNGPGLMIALEGAGPQARTSNNLVGWVGVPSTHGTIIQTAVGSGNLIGSKNPNETDGFTDVHLNLKNLTFRTVMNPGITMVHAGFVTELKTEGTIKFDTMAAGASSFPIQPVQTNGVGLVTPLPNNAGENVIDDVDISGFYNAMTWGEHIVVKHAEIYANWQGINCNTNNVFHHNWAGYIDLEQNAYGIVAASPGCYIDIAALDTELNNVPSWVSGATNQAMVYDPNNYLHGKVRVVFSTYFTRYGGNNIAFDFGDAFPAASSGNLGWNAGFVGPTASLSTVSPTIAVSTKCDGQTKEVSFPPSPPGAEGNGCVATGFNFTGNTVVVRVPHVLQSNSNAYTSFEIGNDSSNYLQIYQNQTTIGFQKKVAGGTTSIATATYSANLALWWRMAESSGAVTASYSPDGINWTTLGTCAATCVSWAYTSTNVAVAAQFIGTGPTYPGYAVFDNLSVNLSAPNYARVEVNDGLFGSAHIQDVSACETSFGITTLSTGGTTTDTGQNCLPANSVIDAVVYRITTTITTAASFTIGDSTTAARFCASQSTLTAGTTGVCMVQWTSATAGTMGQASAASVRVTTNANPGAGAIRLIVYYHTWTPPTS